MIRPIRLESSANARFKLWKRLAQEPRAVRKTGRMLLEGLHLMEAPEALDLGVDALMLDERRASREALEAYRENAGVSLLAYGYLDVSGNVWGAVLACPGEWVDLLVAQELQGGEGAEIAVARFSVEGLEEQGM